MDKKACDSDLFAGIACPADDKEPCELPPPRIRYGAEGLAGMSHRDLELHALRLQEELQQVRNDNEFLSWEFDEFQGNVTFFSRAAKIAHQLNAADVETIAAVAINVLPEYFSSRFAALFLWDAETGNFRVHGTSDPIPVEESGDPNLFWEGLFSLDSQPFVLQYVNSSWVRVNDTDQCIMRAIPESWRHSLGNAALIFPLKVKTAGEGCGLMLGGLVMGALQRNLESHDVDMSAIFSDLLASSLHNANLMKKLNDMAIIDPLTRLHNRRYLIDHLNAAIAQSQRHNQPLSLAMLDIDHFKRFNDQYGHLCGDEVLRMMGSVLKSSTRANVDTAARYGGEEFIVLMPFTESAAAAAAAERLRLAIRGTPVDYSGQTLSVTASIGVAVYAEGETMEQFINRADAALYQAKNDGRDRVCSV